MIYYAAPHAWGVYVEIVGGRPRTTEGYEILNAKVNSILNGLPPMRGYVVIGDPSKDNVLAARSMLMDADTAEEFTFHVHDVNTTRPMTFQDRLPLVASYANSCGPWVQPVEWTLLPTEKLLDVYREEHQKLGYKDILVRYPNER